MITDTQKGIEKVTSSLKDLLFYKNKKYGDSALYPIKIFSKLDAVDSILIRLDDKLSRIKNGKELSKNNVVDIMGYLTLLCVKEQWTDFSEFMD